MHVILTGATGLVGSGVLYHILSLTTTAASKKHVSRVSILSRNPDIPLLSHAQRPTSNTQTKIEVIPHADFKVYPDSLLSTLKSNSGTPPESIAVIWALGMSQNDAKSAEHYTEVTKTYAVNAAKAFALAFAPQQVNFVYVSGEGATAKPGMFTQLFGRVKGETEQELLALATMPEYGNLRVYNVRPGGVDPGAKVDGQPAVDEIWSERMQRTASIGLKAARGLLLPVMRMGVYKSMHSPTEELGRVFLGLGVGDGQPVTGEGVEDGGRTLSNVAIRRLAKEMLS